MAVAYHFFKDFDTTASINDRIRTTYDGPLSLAEDYMVWNITKDDIRVRLANDARTQFISVALTC